VPGLDGSTAAVSQLLDAPVVLVVDASAMSGSVAAVVHGFDSLDPTLQIAAVILNRVGGLGHEELLREALEPLKIPVLGVLYQDNALEWRERHLGLVPVAEDPAKIRASIARLSAVIAKSLDLDGVVALSRTAPVRSVAPVPQALVTGHCRVAVCAGPAFSFVYPENLELLRQAGAELMLFDPLEEPALPQDCDALYAGGGFPEVFASALADNVSLMRDVQQRIASGLVTWAECGGFLWLCGSLDGHEMVGVLPEVQARMTDKLTLGYRTATTRVPSVLGPIGTQFRAHEYHRSDASPPGDALDLTSRFGAAQAGYANSRFFASYLHQHLSATPELAERFVMTASSK
jgi:cobyrinic acid a,c-diamide synthase